MNKYQYAAAVKKGKEKKMTETKDLPTMWNLPCALVADRNSRKLGIQAGYDYMIPVELINSVIIPSPPTEMFKDSISIMFIPRESAEVLNDGICVSYRSVIEGLINNTKERKW
jgi:hypothetical protein